MAELPSEIPRPSGNEPERTEKRILLDSLSSIANIGVELFSRVSTDDFCFSNTHGPGEGWIEFVEMQMRLNDLAPWVFEEERFRSVISGMDVTIAAALDKLFHARQELHQWYLANIDTTRWEDIDGVKLPPPLPASSVENLKRAFQELDSLVKEKMSELVQFVGPKSPSEWGKVFNVSSRTLKRRIEAGEIRAKIIHSKSWKIAADDIPKDPSSGR